MQASIAGWCSSSCAVTAIAGATPGRIAFVIARVLGRLGPNRAFYQAFLSCSKRPIFPRQTNPKVPVHYHRPRSAQAHRYEGMRAESSPLKRDDLTLNRFWIPKSADL